MSYALFPGQAHKPMASPADFVNPAITEPVKAPGYVLQETSLNPELASGPGHLPKTATMTYPREPVL